MVDFKQIPRRRVHVHGVTSHEMRYADVRIGDVQKEVTIDGKKYLATEWNCTQCPTTFLDLWPVKE